GMPYPVDIEMVREFSRECRLMIVIEERRSFLEKNIRDAAHSQLDSASAAELTARLLGKQFPSLDGNKPLEGIPETRGLNPSVLALKLLPLLEQAVDDEDSRKRVSSYLK